MTLRTAVWDEALHKVDLGLCDLAKTCPYDSD